MCFDATTAGSETVNAPRTFSRRSRKVRPAWLSVARRRMSVLGASASLQQGWVLCSEAKCIYGQGPRLVKASLGKFRPVQRHGNDQHLGRSFAGKLSDRLSQKPTQPAGCRIEPAVFEGVDGPF